MVARPMSIDSHLHARTVADKRQEDDDGGGAKTTYVFLSNDSVNSPRPSADRSVWPSFHGIPT